MICEWYFIRILILETCSETMEAMASGSSSASACSEDQSLAFIDHKPSAPGLILYAVAKTINYLVTTGTRWWAAYHGVDILLN
jgi:hypothetical protein